MVGPTKRKPRWTSALLIAIDSLVSAGRRLSVFQALTFGFPPTYCHKNSSNDSPASFIFVRAGVAHGGLHLLLVTNDARVAQDFRDAPGVVARHLVGIEAIERLQERIAFAQDDGPRQPRLESIEDELAEELLVVVDGDAPFGVVISNHLLIGGRPAAAVIHSLKLEEPRGVAKLHRRQSGLSIKRKRPGKHFLASSSSWLGATSPSVQLGNLSSDW